MARPRALLERVRRLEKARAVPRSPFATAWGSFDAFIDHVHDGIDAGTLDGTDMLIVLNCIRRWHSDDVFSA